MTKAAAIHAFWASFGIPAYEENTVPADACLPYLTYELVTDGYCGECAMDASLWYGGESWTEVNAMAERIGEKLGAGGVLLPCTGGKIWLRRASPFAQSMADAEDVRRKQLHITAAYLTNG